MKKAVSKTRFMIDFMALSKPWLYLMVICWFVTILLVWLGNPVFPIQPLAEIGLAWHHIPEIISFLFLGMYLGSLGFLSLENLSYLDGVTLTLVTIVFVAYAASISYFTMFRIVLAIAFVPSFFGFFIVRFHNIEKSKKSKLKTG
jgi:hypothetical protein